MKVYAQFDSAGKIRSLFTLTAPDEFGASLVTERGSFVAEVEGIRLSESDVRDVGKLREIAARHKKIKAFPRVRLE